MIDKLLSQGLSYHQQNRLNEAKTIYEQILKIEPKNFFALKFLATLHAQTNNYQLAVNLFLKAIKINPNDGPCHSNYGNCLKELGRFKDALSAFDKALNYDPNNAATHSNRGVVLFELGRFEEAVTSYERALFLTSNLPETYANKGIALNRLGLLQEALHSFNHSIELAPNFANTYLSRAEIYQQLAQFKDALSDYDFAINLGLKDELIYFNRGNVLKELGRFEEAIESYKVALDFNPYLPEIYCNLGNALFCLRRLEEAILFFDKSIFLNSKYAEAYLNKGNALQEMGRINESLLCYDRAIELAPNFSDAYSNRGLNLEKLKRVDAAIKDFDQAIKISPDHIDAHWNKSLALLFSGDFQSGWKQYEWRLNKSGAHDYNHRLKDEIRWYGDTPIHEKKILICAEQGLGDTIQFSRYIPLVSQMGADVIFQVQRPLLSLFNQFPGVHQLLCLDDAIPSVDFYCPLMSLPLAFHTTIDSIPKDIPYIQINHDKFFYWNKKLQGYQGLKVGLVWNGGFRADQPKLWGVNERRNIPIQIISEALADLDIHFFSLQKGDPAESEIKLLSKKLWPRHNFINLVEELFDFTDTGALIQNLDLIIGVDTSVVHLAGALGKPVWLLNRYDSCWRWHLNRVDSPWYPTLKIYSQTKMNDWQQPIFQIREDLKRLQNDRH